ncbi:MAG: hypothetical protein WBO70_08100 [Erysipelotrichaceae bacterium]
MLSDRARRRVRQNVVEKQGMFNILIVSDMIANTMALNPLHHYYCDIQDGKVYSGTDKFEFIHYPSSTEEMFDFFVNIIKEHEARLKREGNVNKFPKLSKILSCEEKRQEYIDSINGVIFETVIMANENTIIDALYDPYITKDLLLDAISNKYHIKKEEINRRNINEYAAIAVFRITYEYNPYNNINDVFIQSNIDCDLNDDNIDEIFNISPSKIHYLTEEQKSKNINDKIISISTQNKYIFPQDLTFKSNILINILKKYQGIENYVDFNGDEVGIFMPHVLYDLLPPDLSNCVLFLYFYLHLNFTNPHDELLETKGNKLLEKDYYMELLEEIKENTESIINSIEECHIYWTDNYYHHKEMTQASFKKTAIKKGIKDKKLIKEAMEETAIRKALKDEVLKKAVIEEISRKYGIDKDIITDDNIIDFVNILKVRIIYDYVKKDSIEEYHFDLFIENDVSYHSIMTILNIK